MEQSQLVQALTLDLQTEEGFSAKAYPDSLSFLTIGNGFNLDDQTAPATCAACGLDYHALRGGAEITRAQAGVLLAHGLAGAIKDAVTLVPGFWGLCDGAQLAFADMCYNMGRTKLAEFYHLLKALSMEPPQYLWASHEMQDSAWYKQVGGRGPKLVTEMLECVKNV